MSKDDPKNIRVLAFLDAYKKQECLWNPALNSYKIKADRNIAYDEIIRDLDLPLLTPHDIKLKIKAIRTTYTKELRIMDKYKHQGKLYKPKLFWFKKANSFLKNVCTLRQYARTKALLTKDASVTNQDLYKDCTIEYASDVSGDEVGDNEGVEDEPTLMLQDTATETDDCVGPIDYETIVHIVNRDGSHGEPVQHKISTEQPSMEQSFVEHNGNEPPPPAESTQKYDEFDVFCRSIAAQLRSIPDSYSRSVAKLKIQQILFEAETGHYYKSNPCISIPIVQQINSL